MRLVPFKKGMLPAFREMLAESKSEFRPPWARHIERVFSQGSTSGNGARNFAMLEKGKPIALLSTRMEVEALVIYFLLVKKGFRGRGAGAALVRRAEKMAAASGAAFLRLDTYPGKKAIAFYRKMGFSYGGSVKYYEEEGDHQQFFYKKLKQAGTPAQRRSA